jgi:pimeloyl-ACP methyl ester carboxylesterase
VKLVYLDFPSVGGTPAVVLHREADLSVDRMVGLVREAGADGRVVAPFGDYAFYPSGMEIGGLCWYRLLPGYAGTDPVSLAKAVVQVCDLLDDLDLERPMVAGFGQGAVVALGAGLARAGRVGAVVSVDPWPAHVPSLPAAIWDGADAPPVLLAGTHPDDGPELERLQGVLAARDVAAGTWCWTGDGGAEGAGPALAAGVRGWSAGIGDRAG